MIPHALSNKLQFVGNRVSSEYGQGMMNYGSHNQRNITVSTESKQLQIWKFRKPSRASFVTNMNILHDAQANGNDKKRIGLRCALFVLDLVRQD